MNVLKWVVTLTFSIIVDVSLSVYSYSSNGIELRLYWYINSRRLQHSGERKNSNQKNRSNSYEWSGEHKVYVCIVTDEYELGVAHARRSRERIWKQKANFVVVADTIWLNLYVAISTYEQKRQNGSGTGEIMQIERCVCLLRSFIDGGQFNAWSMNLAKNKMIRESKNNATRQYP